MTGKSPVRATPERVRLLETKAGGADRARSILLTLRGWTGSRLAEAFGVREDTVRLWRSQFMNGGVEALETRPLPGPEPAKTEAILPDDRADWRIQNFTGKLAPNQQTCSASMANERRGNAKYNTGCETCK